MICKVCHHCGLCEGDCSFVPDKNVLIEQSLSLPVAATIPEFTSTLCDSSALPSEIGIAFDIGTTTIAAAAYTLHDAKKISSCGEQNLQSMFGTDVIARISFALSDDGYNALHTTILIQLNKMMKQLLAEIEPRFLSERKGRALLKRIVIAGNTAMESFAAGVSVKGLSSFPFSEGSKFGYVVPANKLFNEKSVVPPDAEIYFAPVVSAFVGGDTVCAMTACGFGGSHRQIKLLADIGTNCEMALFNPLTEKINCTSSAAGPAFEGQTITCGMAAVEGSIAEVRIVPEATQAGAAKKIVCNVIGGGEAKGLCGTGLLSACASLYTAGMIDENGTIVCGATAAADGTKQIVLAEHVVLTQKDIRNFQLAKAAVASGIETLLDGSSAAASVLYLAGGFGTALGEDDARVTGLIPPSFAGKIVGVGNAALAGATLMLFGSKWRKVAEEIASCSQNEDLAQDSAFQSRYITALNFPLHHE